MTRRTHQPRAPRGDEAGGPTETGPLAGAEPASGLPLEDPPLADRSNPRWGDRRQVEGAQSLVNPDGTPNVMPPAEPRLPMPTAEEQRTGTPQDQAARTLEPEVGRDNIREGRGGGTPNPALAEGGDNG